MSEYRVVNSSVDARALLPGIDGIVVMSLEGCEPCDTVWNALALEPFDGIARTKIVLSVNSRDDRAFIRELEITGFPTLIAYAKGVSGRRMVGAIESDNLAAVAGAIASVLKLPRPAAPAREQEPRTVCV
jgi:hypothetical protein